MSPEQNVQFVLGQLTASVEALSDQVESLSSTVETLAAHMNQTKGGFRILLMVGSASAAIGAGIASLVQWLPNLVGKTPHG